MDLDLNLRRCIDAICTGKGPSTGWAFGGGKVALGRGSFPTYMDLEFSLHACVNAICTGISPC